MFTNCFLPLPEFLRSCFLHVAIVLNPDVWFLTWGKAILPNDGWLIFVGVVAMVFTGSCLHHHHHHHQWHLIAMNYWNKMITTTPPPPPPLAITAIATMTTTFGGVASKDNHRPWDLRAYLVLCILYWFFFFTYPSIHFLKIVKHSFTLLFVSYKILLFPLIDLSKTRILHLWFLTLELHAWAFFTRVRQLLVLYNCIQ